MPKNEVKTIDEGSYLPIREIEEYIHHKGGVFFEMLGSPRGATYPLNLVFSLDKNLFILLLKTEWNVTKSVTRSISDGKVILTLSDKLYRVMRMGSLSELMIEITKSGTEWFGLNIQERKELEKRMWNDERKPNN